eukprot:UN13444
MKQNKCKFIKSENEVNVKRNEEAWLSLQTYSPSFVVLVDPTLAFDSSV